MESSTIDEKIASLNSDISRRSREHIQKGSEYRKKKSFSKAKKEFLTSLRYDPDNAKALKYLKEVSIKTNYKEYRTVKGDTLSKIASVVYKAPDMDFIISYFNDLCNDSVIEEGTVLKLPVIDSIFLVNTKELLKEAESNYRAKKYFEAISTAEKLLHDKTFGKEAENLINRSYYQMGKNLLFKKNYLESVKILENVRKSYKDVKALLSMAGRKIKKQAELHYQRGVSFFMNEQLGKAIREWEEALKYNADHKEARKGLIKAGNLLEKLKATK